MRKASPRMRYRVLIAAAAAMAAGMAAAAVAQAAPAPGYDVVSIKPDKSGLGGISVNINDGKYMATNLPLNMLVMYAYGLKTNDQLSGLPGWAESSRFDIEAKMDAETAAAVHKLPRDEREKVELEMMQAMLAERFQIKLHHETKVLSSYVLVIAKSGLKIKEADPNDAYANGIKGPDGQSHAGSTFVSNGKMTCQGIPIANLVRNISGMVQRQVEDKTGLTGKYDFVLTFTPEGMPPESKETTGVETAPSIFTALQEQLGLKLESMKGPVDTIVVDHVEMPSAN